MIFSYSLLHLIVAIRLQLPLDLEVVSQRFFVPTVEDAQTKWRHYRGKSEIRSNIKVNNNLGSMYESAI